MSNYSRKDFLRLTSWGLAATLLPIYKIEAISNAIVKNKKTTNEDFVEAQQYAKKAKELFYFKYYDKSEELYLLAISLAPAYIQFYDGLDNVFGAQNKYLESIQLYKVGLENNPNIISFYDRAARSLLRLETGNKSLASQYRNTINSATLLNDALLLYNTALEINSKQFLTIGRAKVLRKINIAPLDPNFKVNRVYKNLKNQNKTSYNLTLSTKSNEEIKLLIERIDSKDRRELYNDYEKEQRKKHMLLQKKKYYELLQNRQNLSDAEKLDNVEKLFEIDYKDPKSIIKIKKAYYSTSRYYDFIEVKRKFAENSKTVFSYIGLMDAMEVAYNKQQATNEVLEDAISIGYDLLNNWSLIDQNYVEVVIKMVKIMLKQSNFQQANELLINTMGKIKVDSININNKLIMFYAKICMTQGNFEKARKILLLGVNKLEKETVETYTNDDDSLRLVYNLSQYKKEQTLEDNIPLYYMLYSCYISLQDNIKSLETISMLQQKNPQDEFVLKRI